MLEPRRARRARKTAVPSSFPRTRESSTCHPPGILDSRVRGNDAGAAPWSPACAGMTSPRALRVLRGSLEQSVLTERLRLPQAAALLGAGTVTTPRDRCTYHSAHARFGSQ